MKKLIFILLAVTLISCNQSKKKLVMVDFNTYKGYFVKNDVLPSNDVLFFASTKIAEFEKLFGIAATMSRHKWIEKENFANKVIIAIANKEDNLTKEVRIDSIKKQGDALFVHFAIDELENPTTYTARHCMVAVTSVIGVEKVVFCKSGNEIKQLDVE